MLASTQKLVEDAGRRRSGNGEDLSRGCPVGAVEAQNGCPVMGEGNATIAEAPEEDQAPIMGIKHFYGDEVTVRATFQAAGKFKSM